MIMNNFNIILMTIIIASGLMNAVLLYENYQMRELRVLLDRRHEVSELLIKQLEMNGQLKNEIIDGYKKLLELERQLDTITSDENEIV